MTQSQFRRVVLKLPAGTYPSASASYPGYNTQTATGIVVSEGSAATQDFETAMRYLRKSAVITQGHVESAVGTGLRDAYVVSRDAVARQAKETGG